MQRVSLKIHRELKNTFYQPDTLYPIFRGNGGTRGTSPDITQKKCISVCTPLLKMYPLLYLGVYKENGYIPQLYPVLPLLYGRKELQR